MKNYNTLLFLLALPMLLASCFQEKEELPTRGKVLTLVSESQADVVRQEVEEFERLYPDAHVRMKVTSTRDAIVQLINDSVHIVVVDRKLNGEERRIAQKAGLEFTEIVIAEDALGVVVHPTNPAKSTTVDALRAIFSGTATEWNTVPGMQWTGPVMPALTGRNSGTYELLTKQFLSLQGDARLAMVADSQRAVISYVASHPHAIGIVPVATLRDSLEAVRVVPVEHVDSTGAKVVHAPHQAYIYQRIYPLHYPVYVYVRAGVKGVASGFSTFMASAPGQKIFVNAGLAPATMPVRLVSLHQEEQQ